MKAIIFAAGIGSRLGKITENQPKALVEIGGITLLELAIQKLKKQRIDEIIINVHHYADMIKEFLEKKGNFGIRIELSDERELLLETGGGLMKASWFFDDKEPFITHNVDVLSTLDLSALLQHHESSQALITLACKKRSTQRYFLTNQENHLVGWENIQTGERIDSLPVEGIVHQVGYSCVSVIDPAIFKLVTETGVFSLTSLFLRLAKEHPIMVYRHDPDFWMDIGKPDELDTAKNYFKERDIFSL